MKKYALAILCAFSTVYAQSQTVDEILQRSKSDSILKLRAALYDQFLKQDTNAVRILKKELLLKADSNYIPLAAVEGIAIDFWTGSHQSIIEASLKEPVTQRRYWLYQNNCYQQPSLEKIISTIKADSISVLSGIQNAALSPEDKDFLKLVYRYHFHSKSHPSQRENDDELNRLAGVYLLQYPSGPKSDFVKKQIRYIQKDVALSWGAEFYTGVALYQGNLKTNFTNAVPLGLGLHFYYKHILLDFRMAASLAGKTNRSIPVKDTFWAKGAYASTAILDINAGYAVWNKNRIRVSPFAGITGVGISASTKDEEKLPQLKNGALKVTGALALGAALDIRLNRRTDNGEIYWGLAKRETFVRLRYAYINDVFRHRYPAFSGNIHNITIGIGNLITARKRAE